MTSSFEDPRRVLKRYGLKPKRSWGQNFLVNRSAVEKIAELCAAEPGMRIIEIGAGLGTLTRSLLDTGASVIAIEQDRDLCEILELEFGKNERFQLVEADAAKYDYFERFGSEPGVLAGNLPYQITGRIMRLALRDDLPLVRSVLMVQEEVAKRLAAEPGSKSRGALSAMAQIRRAVRIAMRLPPSAFHPQPKVRSAVVELRPLDISKLGDVDGDLFDRTVKAAFSGRRKTIRNSLVFGRLGTPETVANLLFQAGIDPNLRAENISNESFVELARAASKLG